MVKLFKIIFLVLGIILFIMFSLTYYTYIIQFSILSVRHACMEITTETLEANGFSLAGTYSEQTDKITIYDPNPMILKHEACHRIQAQERRLYGCYWKHLMFLNELECYTKQYLPF